MGKNTQLTFLNIFGTCVNYLRNIFGNELGYLILVNQWTGFVLMQRLVRNEKKISKDCISIALISGVYFT